jgi:GTP-binding protein HflX
VSIRPPHRGETTISTHVEGNLKGIKPSQKKALERTYRRKMTRQEVVSVELARHLTQISRELGRQIGVVINREGAIKNVIVGDATQLHLPDIGRLRGGVGRFRGLRLVHTHLRGEPLTADDLNDLALLRLDAVVMIAAEENGQPGRVEVAMISPGSIDDETVTDAAELFQRFEARDLYRLDLDFEAEIEALEEEFTRKARGGAGKTVRERALVIGVVPDDDRFAEVLELVNAAGVIVAGTMRQKRMRVHPKTVVGKGKLTEIVLESMRRRAEVAIFDIDLKPAQARAFEDATGLKAIDRTQLILDIFAQRAKSRDGKLQVELAQLKYSIPRLTEKDAGLSRLTGGIGGRGPGETVMEIGRRRLNDRIRTLEKQVDQLSNQRGLRRRRRRESDLPVLSIVGYTNAGKSTLLNAMTKSKVEVADQLFMTLDPTSRRLRFPREGEVVLTDTVGFLSDLPEDLVAAFRATLEELTDADLLLHVVDIADPRLEEKMKAVQKLLEELDLSEIPCLLVLNKADLLPPAEALALANRHHGVAVSATKRQGLRRLITAAEDALHPKQPMLKEYGEVSEQPAASNS